MGYGYRYFAFMDDGSIRRVPVRWVDNLCRGIDVMPEFSEKRIKVASVILKLERRRPLEILKIDGEIWEFDERGSPQPSLADGAIEASATYNRVKEEKADTGRVVSVSGRIARKRWTEKYRWELTRTEVNRIIELIWPKKR